MTTKGYMIVDGSNVGFAASAGPKLSVGDFETQGIYNFVRKLRVQVERFPSLKPVVVWDGASWRHRHFKPYKANRVEAPTKPHDLEMEALRKSFVAQRVAIQDMLFALGVTQMQAANLEGDDLAGLLVRAKRTPETRFVLLTGDWDWLQLVDERTVWIDPVNTKTRKFPIITMRNFEEATGVASARQFLEMKAIIGDVSDNIPGVGGIGEKGAIALLKVFGGVGDFFNQWIDKSIKDANKLPKKFRDFAESDEKQDIYRRNLVLMDLHAPQIPRPMNMTVRAQKFDRAAFVSQCKSYLFTSILDTEEKFTAPFEAVSA